MFGLGMPEILLILAIALIVIGPKKLPELAKTLGRAMGEFKRSAQDFKRSIDMDATMSDIDPPPATDLKKVVKEANEASAADNKADDDDNGDDDLSAPPEKAETGEDQNPESPAAPDEAPQSPSPKASENS